MNIAEKIRANANTTGLIANPVKGRWFAIKFFPDLFAADAISIGVGFINSEGIIGARFAEDYSRLQCFYDDSLNISDIEFLADVLDEAIIGLHEEEWKSANYGPSISFSTPSFAQGRSETEILDSLFESAVPIARPRPQNADIKTRIRFESEATVCKKVGESLISRHENVAPMFHQKGYTYNIDNNKGHQIKVHLKDEGFAAGYLASALFADRFKAEVHVRRGVDTLRTLRAHVPEKQRIGLFVVRPGEAHGLTTKFLEGFDKLMDGLSWKLEDDNIDLRDADNPDLMADQIAEWYQAA